MTTEQLRELRDLAARATSGPYSADQIAALTRPPLREADAAFVAAVSPERIVALVDEVIESRKAEKARQTGSIDWVGLDGRRANATK